MSFKLHDAANSGQTDEHDEIWALLPWYVNGSLPENEAANVDHHSAHCVMCTGEIGIQSRLANLVASQDCLNVSAARSWETLHAKVRADIAARTPPDQPSGWLAHLAHHRMLLMGTIATACIAAVVGVQLYGKGPDGFTTLTAPSKAPDNSIRFHAAEETTLSELTVLLKVFGPTDISGPSETGLYTAFFETNADLSAIAVAMVSMKAIVVALPKVRQ